VIIMNKTTRLATTALAALLVAAPVAAFAASGAGVAGGTSSAGAPGLSGTETSQSVNPPVPQNPTDAGPTAGHPGDMTAGETGHHQQVSANTMQNVQQQLQQQGYYSNAQVDGKWGPETRKAVQSFQQAKGLPATGRLDGQTLGALGVTGG